jgi:hypothetical protein
MLFAMRPACANASEGRPKGFWRRVEVGSISDGET